MPNNGAAVAVAATGVLFVYGGLTGKSPIKLAVYLLLGRKPEALPQNQPIGGDTSGNPTPESPPNSSNASSGNDVATPGAASSNKQTLKNAAAAHGWDTGAEWDALNSVEMREAGYNSTATGSETNLGHAFGMAQALGHGGKHTQGSLSNQYGGYGLSTQEAVAANSGDAAAQAKWMINYIKDTYGDPITAWNHELSAGWY